MEKDRHIELSWKLIGYKMMYYTPEQVHLSWKKELDITDCDYDKLEKEYLRLCLQLSLPNTVAGQTAVDGTLVEGSGMIELDKSRHSVSLVCKKYSNRKLI